MQARQSVGVMLWCGALLALAACTAEQDAPVPQPPPAPATPPEAPVPTASEFGIALWPGEGIPEFDAVGNPLPLRSAPSAEAAAHDTLRPAAGSRVRYDSTNHRTVTAAAITVLRPDTISGRDFGAARMLSREAYTADVPVVRIAVTTASQLSLLQHRAEGTCFVTLDGRVIEADPCPLFDAGAFRPSGTPITEWWIFAIGGSHGGGWIPVSDSTVRLAGRRF